MSKTSILLAEDNPGHQELLRAAITEGFADVELCIVANAEQACQMVRKRSDRPFDCVLLDFNLPDENAALAGAYKFARMTSH